MRVVPVWLAIYLGKDAIQTLLNTIPTVVTDVIGVLGGLLPALGIAMLMNILIKNKVELIFFFFGFVMIAFAKLNTIALVFIAALIAYIIYLSSENKVNSEVETSAGPIDEKDIYEDDDLF